MVRQSSGHPLSAYLLLTVTLVVGLVVGLYGGGVLFRWNSIRKTQCLYGAQEEKLEEQCTAAMFHGDVNAVYYLHAMATQPFDERMATAAQRQMNRLSDRYADAPTAKRAEPWVPEVARALKTIERTGATRRVAPVSGGGVLR